MMNKLELEIINTIAEEGDIDKSEIKLDSNLYDLGIDSLSSLEILVALENKYDITIAQERLRNVDSVRKIITIVSSELRKKQRKT
jgi:acyl carrier protein